ncbi:MAG: hypothetical protein HYZ42_18660 [Bacteroidetes bacterium]|nr:hypothetical protein [Bacteroidota bacterium]
MVAQNSAQDRFSISVHDTLKHQFKGYGSSFSVKVGTVNLGQPSIDYGFYITNHSDTPLIITNASWAELLLAPYYQSEPIVKGQIGLIKYRLMETRNRTGGHYAKTGHVETNLGDLNIRFLGINLPDDIYIDRPMIIDTVELGDTMISEFSIYNKSDTSSLTIDTIIYEPNTIVEYDNNEKKNTKIIIPTHSYKYFKVLYIPNQTGNSNSNISLIINDPYCCEVDVEYNIYATVLKRKKK